MSAAAQNSQMTSVGPGDFVWHELRTTDAAAALDFYAHVVGWKPQSSGDPGGMPYTLFAAGEVTTAGLMQLTPEMMQAGMAPAWVGFIGVNDVDEYAERVQQAGGKLHCAPQDIPGIGRFVSFEDPQGATVLLFKSVRDETPARPPLGTPGTIGWNELWANEGESAWTFYADLIGWSLDRTMDMGPNGLYRIFKNRGSAIGGVVTRDPNQSPVPYWLFYFVVEDIDAATARVRDKNGSVQMGPHQIPDGLWIVIGRDPQGATFALVGPRRSEQRAA
jgi:predicted enzyme related to lactoylglutathione lyase